MKTVDEIVNGFNCVIRIEENASLVIRNIVNESHVITGHKVIRLNGQSLSINSEVVKQELKSGDWHIFLGSHQTHYELLVKSEPNNSYEFNMGSGPYYLSDYIEDKHFAGNQWYNKPNVCYKIFDPNYAFESIISNENNNPMTDLKMDMNWNQSVMASEFDSFPVLDYFNQFCETYFASDVSDEDKSELSQAFNTYLALIIPELCQQLNHNVLDREPGVAQVSGKCYVFGDIHGNLQDLYDYSNMFWLGSERTASYVFCGDYVDRGPNSVEVSVLLLALRLSEPNRFTLIRGNHEIRSVNKRYTFFNECIQKFGREVGEEIWDQINSCFERLPVAAVIDNRVFCCHGGVPKSMTSIEDLSRIPKPMTDPEDQCPAAHELMWNDPIESMKRYNRGVERELREENIEFIENSTRRTGFYWTALAAQRFLDSNGLTHMIRAHEAVKEGFRVVSNHRVITVFSCSHYCRMNNTTACVEVTDTEIRIIILKVGIQSMGYYNS